MRQYETAEKKISGWFFKVVERGGDSLVDLIHKSDPWAGEDCERDQCKPCWTKIRLGKFKSQDCTKRNCIYETWCISCWERDKAKVEEMCKDDEKMEAMMMKRMKIYKYVGETSRSIYERTWEHVNSLKQLHTSSQMLKHIVEEHGEDEIDNVEFGAKVVRYTRNAFERQVIESVIIFRR